MKYRTSPIRQLPRDLSHIDRRASNLSDLDFFPFDKRLLTVDRKGGPGRAIDLYGPLQQSPFARPGNGADLPRQRVNA